MLLVVVLIAAVAFAGRLYFSAAALRSWPLAIGTVLVAAAVYLAPLAAGFPVGRMVAMLGRPFSAVLAPLAFVLGFGIPTLLKRQERAPRTRNAAAVAAGVLTLLFLVDLTFFAQVALWHPFLAPHLWFAAGVALYVALRSDFYDRSPNPADYYETPPSQRNRRRA